MLTSAHAWLTCSLLAARVSRRHSVQEDFLLGDLRHFLRPEVLATADVITPNTGSPRRLRANGAMMAFRNAPRVNQLWRSSKDAGEMLNSTGYRVFDDWVRASLTCVTSKDPARLRIPSVVGLWHFS